MLRIPFIKNVVLQKRLQIAGEKRNEKFPFAIPTNIKSVLGLGATEGTDNKS